MVEDSGLRAEASLRRALLCSVLAARNAVANCLTGRAEMMWVGGTTTPDFVVICAKAYQHKVQARSDEEPTNLERLGQVY